MKKNQDYENEVEFRFLFISVFRKYIFKNLSITKIFGITVLTKEQIEFRTKYSLFSIVRWSKYNHLLAYQQCAQNIQDCIKNIQECKNNIDVNYNNLQECNRNIIECKQIIGRLNTTVSLLTREQALLKSSSVFKVLFLVHNINTIDCFIPVINAMKKHPRFKVIVASIKRHFLGDKVFGMEDETSNALSKLNIEHLRLNYQEPAYLLDAIIRIHPHFIFRQSPWDADIEPTFAINNLSFAKVCYIPYFGQSICKFNSKVDDLDVNQHFHNVVWRIFTDQNSAIKYNQKQDIHGSNVVITGNTKYEYIRDALKDEISKRTIV